MRFHEFYQNLEEGGKSDSIRYNSEVGVLYGFIGRGKFNPESPEASIPSTELANPTSCYKDIKNLVAPNFMPDTFELWAAKAPEVKEKILEKQGNFPRKLGWSGGQNIAGGVADIAFADGPTIGISVKAEGGITLANLTPKALGIETDKGVDVFDMYAGEEYLQMKQQVFAEVLELSKRQPNKPLMPIDRYGITYVPETEQFTINLKNGTVSMTEEQIMGAIRKNKQWQRVFGDWFQANFAEKKAYATPLYSKIAKVFEATIEKSLSESAKLAGILRFGPKPYYYLSAKGLYYVPSANDVQNLQLKKIRYAQPNGTAQRFIAEIGRADSKDNAELDIYIRYANGMFESNPTVRIQSLKNPQYIGWELL
jgi:hypothetical protein